MKKLITFVLCISLVFVMASCQNDPHGVSGIAEVNLTTATEKSLTSQVDRSITHWQFMATPLFSVAANETIYGKVSNWKELPDLNTPVGGDIKTATTLGRYTSGNWLFELRALNAQDKIIAVGSTKQIIRSGIDNNVAITVLTDRKDGTHGESIESGKIQFGFETVKLDDNIEIGDSQHLKIITTYQKVDKHQKLEPVQTANLNWTATDTGGTPDSFYGTEKIKEGRTYYSTILPAIDAGPYIFTIKFQGKNSSNSFIDLGGQSFEVMVVGGETSTVKGTLLANDFIIAGLKITAPGKIVGTINGKHYIIGTPGTPVTLQYIHDTENSAEVPTRWYWYVNNELKVESNSDTFIFDCPEATPGKKDWLFGIYKVTCVPAGALGSLGQTVIDVVFNPPQGPNQGEFDWGAAGV